MTNDANEFLQTCGQGNLSKEEITLVSNAGLIDQTDYSYIAKYLWNFEKTVYIETNAKVIWILTPDFYWEVKSSIWSQIIFENVIKGSRYFYLYKDDQENRKNLKNYISRLKTTINNDWEKQVHFVPLNPFNLPWYAEHALYNPYDTVNEHCIIINPLGNTGNLDNFNVEIVEGLRIEFREYFKKIWNKKVKDPYWKIYQS